jgi:hypothetical protein
MLSDKELIDVSYEVDNVLSALMEKYKISPLAFSAIVLARLMRLVQEVDSDSDFKQIMSSAIGMKTKEDRVLQ